MSVSDLMVFDNGSRVIELGVSDALFAGGWSLEATLDAGDADGDGGGILPGGGGGGLLGGLLNSDDDVRGPLTCTGPQSYTYEDTGSDGDERFACAPSNGDSFAAVGADAKSAFAVGENGERGEWTLTDERDDYSIRVIFRRVLSE